MSTLALYEKICVHPDHMQTLGSLSSENLDDFLNKNDIKTTDNEVKANDSNRKLTDSNVLVTVVDAFCNPEVLLKVSQLLTSRFIKRHL